MEKGSLKSCGANRDGQLGDGTYDDNFDASVLLDTDVARIYAGPAARTAFFAAADGTVYGAGASDRGQLGAGRRATYPFPVEVRFQSEALGTDMSVSSTHAVARSLSGDASSDDDAAARRR